MLKKHESLSFCLECMFVSNNCCSRPLKPFQAVNCISINEINSPKAPSLVLK